MSIEIVVSRVLAGILLALCIAVLNLALMIMRGHQRLTTPRCSHRCYVCQPWHDGDPLPITENDAAHDQLRAAVTNLTFVTGRRVHVEIGPTEGERAAEERAKVQS